MKNEASGYVRNTFDESYFKRFYMSPKTRVENPYHVAKKLARFIQSWADLFEIPCHTILEIGSGTGQLSKAFHVMRKNNVHYITSDVSTYACEKYQHTIQLDVANAKACRSFKGKIDLVICRGVLPYLDEKAVAEAITNMAEMLQPNGMLYLEAVTWQDKAHGRLADQTDPDMRLHEVGVYSAILNSYFDKLGGGMWIKRSADITVFELE